jgi:hypothetical protein
MSALIWLVILAPPALLSWLIWRFLHTQVLQNEDLERAVTEGRSLGSTRSVKGTAVREAEGPER